MVTLNDWNKERNSDYISLSQYPRKNGIACPGCGKELSDSDCMVLASLPPQRNVHCESCGYSGYRIG